MSDQRWKLGPWMSLALLAFFWAIPFAHAQGALGSDWARFLPDLPLFRDTSLTGEELAIAFIKNGVRIVKYIVGGVAIIFGILYAAQFVFAGSKQETIDKQKKNFTGVIIAFLLLMIGDTVATLFNPEASTSEKLIDFEAANDQLRTVATYLKWFFGSIIILLMTVSGIRLMTAQGEEEVITKQKRNLTWSLIGMLIMLMASNIVNAIYVIKAPDEFAPATPETGIQEVAGVIRLILIFLGPLAILLTIYAGFMYLTAFDDEEKTKKATRMITGGVVGIVIITIAYAVVNTIIQGRLAP